MIFPRDYEQVGGAADIGLIVDDRIFGRLADQRFRREMEDPIDLLASKDVTQSGQIPQVGLENLLTLSCPSVSGGKVIENDSGVTLL